ncbi:hypothetical protein, partial [Pseudomonas viridiflava]|uniref:hypothetical protein n=1 Tax=Pseudomonas viridiflava TaxID=33069 RepID=UPI00197DE04A
MDYQAKNQPVGIYRVRVFVATALYLETFDGLLSRPGQTDFSAQCIAVIAQLVGTLSNDIMLRSQTPVTIIDV